MGKTNSKRSLLTRVVLGLVFFIALIYGIVFLTTQTIPDHPVFSNFDTYPLVIGHADDTGNGLWPGGTMPFLEGSAELGVDMLEMDINMTRDGRIILMHDTTVDRTTDGTGAIPDLTFEEIQALNVAVNWTKDNGQTYPYRDQHLKVPTLDEVFERFPGYPMVIEIKQENPDMTGPFCELIRNHNMTNKIMVGSFSDIVMENFRQICPEVATSPSGGDVRKFVFLNFAFLSGILRPNYQVFQVPVESSGITVITKQFVNAAHRQNLQVQVWTINDPAEMEHLIDIGVDGIMTDRPDILFDILGRSR